MATSDDETLYLRPDIARAARRSISAARHWDLPEPDGHRGTRQGWTIPTLRTWAKNRRPDLIDAIEALAAGTRLSEEEAKAANPRHAIRKWSEEDTAYALRDDISVAQIAEDLGRTQKAVYAHRYTHGKHEREAARWTKDEDEYLAREDLSTAQIAEDLGRTISSVRARRAKLLGPQFTRRPWSEDEDAYILRDDITAAVMAQQLGRSEGSIMVRRHRLRQSS